MNLNRACFAGVERRARGCCKLTLPPTDEAGISKAARNAAATPRSSLSPRGDAIKMRSEIFNEIPQRAIRRGLRETGEFNNRIAVRFLAAGTI